MGCEIGFQYSFKLKFNLYIVPCLLIYLPFKQGFYSYVGIIGKIIVSTDMYSKGIFFCQKQLVFRDFSQSLKIFRLNRNNPQFFTI